MQYYKHMSKSKTFYQDIKTLICLFNSIIFKTSNCADYVLLIKFWNIESKSKDIRFENYRVFIT